MADSFLANGMRITILSPRQVQKRYLSSKLNRTHMSKWALEALENGWKVTCVYRKGLNNSVSHKLDNLNLACSALTRYLNNYMVDITCVDMSHRDAFYLAYKER